MSQSGVEIAVAKALVRSLVERLTPDGHGNFVASASSSDREALRLLSDGEGASSEPKPKVSKAETPRFGAPAIVSSAGLELGCLEAEPDPEGDVLAVDFGTAFSKAAVWKAGAIEPTPLALRDQVSAASGLMLDSYVYVTDGVVYFGMEAQAIFRQENATGRRLFDSPKGELNVLKGSNLHQAAPPEIDPTGQLSKRDLLTLYLAYLTAATVSALQVVGSDRHMLRRYAIPVWEPARLDSISSVLRGELVNAQVLADTLPMDVWRKGLAVADAAPVLKRLRQTVTDEQRKAARFMGGHVLEAAAAAASVGESLANRRPVALVLDVGAGTTDVGLYRFTLPKSGAKVFPFEKGRGASTCAGNTLDSQVISFLKEQAGIQASTADSERVGYALARDIRDHKATLFQTGFVDVEELDGARFQLNDFLASPQAKAFTKQLRHKITGFLNEVSHARMTTPDGLFGVVTGGGANASIFRDLFDQPFVLEDGTAKFERLDVEPAWVSQLQPEIAPIFPQLAVAVGACSPDLPEERNAITDASSAPVRQLSPMYR